MNRRAFVTGLGAVLAAQCAVQAEAQQAAKMYRIGFLAYGALATFEQPLSAFKESLRQLGYVEGQNFVLEMKTADGDPQQPPALARELVNRRVDVIVAGSSITTRAAKEATRTIPIVMAGAGYPASAGLATISVLESAWLQGPVFLMLHRDLDRGLIKAFILKTVEARPGRR